MKCMYCNSEHTNKDGNHNGCQRYKCLDCKKRFDKGVYNKENQYIIHFRIKLNKNERNTLTRENYCISTNQIDYKEKKNIKTVKEFYEKNNRYPNLCPEYYKNIPNEVFLDEEHYTDNFIEEHYKNCMENFDLNMMFFSRINQNEFGKLLNGTVENSILSIDSFGALDTTRIFYKELPEIRKLDEYEENLIREFRMEFRLNRVLGGINCEKDSAIRNLRLRYSVQKRELKH